MDYKTKGETIEYAIKKECRRDSLVEWCKMWDFTIDDFYKFLEIGRQGFDSREQDDEV